MVWGRRLRGHHRASARSTKPAEQGAVSRLPNGRYEVVIAKMPDAIRSLAIAKELLTIEASGDRLRNEAWFAK